MFVPFFSIVRASGIVTMLIQGSEGSNSTKRVLFHSSSFDFVKVRIVWFFCEFYRTLDVPVHDESCRAVRFLKSGSGNSISRIDVTSNYSLS